MELLSVAKDWQDERVEADSLLRSLYDAHADDAKHRRWLLRRWPEWRAENPANVLPDPEIFIPELFLRDCEDDVSQSLQSIKSLVIQSFGLLRADDDDDDEDEEVSDIARGSPRLSHSGLVEAFPMYLQKLRRKALHSILSALSGRRREARNRPWLLDKINHEWKKLAGGPEADRSPTILRKILAVLQDPNSFQDEVPPGQLLLEASCPWTAAKAAFNQLHQLPLPCLQVMLEVLLEKPPDGVVGKLPAGGNKERVVRALIDKSFDLLHIDQTGKELPEFLRKSLGVMSVSARYAFGSDDNLISFLGPQSPEVKVLQDNLLSALSDLEKLSYDNLQRMDSEFIRMTTAYKKWQPSYLRHSIRKILLDCLLRSEVRPVPEEVINISSNISSMMKQQHMEKTDTIMDSEMSATDDAQIDLEAETTLRVSTHLQQIASAWNELSSEKSPFEKCPRLGVEHCTVGFDGVVHSAQIKKENIDECLPEGDDGETMELPRYSTDAKAERADQQVGLPEDLALAMPAADEITQINLEDMESVQSPLTEAREMQCLTRVGDQVAEVGYSIIGSAMEKTLRHSGLSLRRPVRKYLRSSMTKWVRSQSGLVVDGDQLTAILSIAERIPMISPRVMNNIKRRLGLE